MEQTRRGKDLENRRPGKGREELNMVNRKLIRPTLSEIQTQMGAPVQRKRPAPPEQTNAENFYYIKQMQARTPMVVVLDTGEQIRGVIEWYDKSCIKVHRPKDPNLLIMKWAIRYMYKQTESKDNGGDHQPNSDTE
jgi:host factor-I protein